jgi:hypothetical protein
MDSAKKIKLKKSVLLKMEKRQAWALDPGTDTIVKFSKGMAKVMGILDEKRGVTLEDIQKKLKVTRKTVQGAVQLLAKLNLLVGSKGDADLTAGRMRARKKEVGISGFGKVIVMSGATVLASGALLGRDAAALHCATCATHCTPMIPFMAFFPGHVYAPHVIVNTLMCDCAMPPLTGGLFSGPCTTT